MPRLVIRDLRLYGEDEIFLADEVRDLITSRKLEVLDNALKTFKPDEVVLENPISDRVPPKVVEDLLEKLKGYSVVISPKMEIYDCVLLPENVTVSDETFPGDFSSSPVNNVPKVFVEGKGIVELDVPPLWIIDVGPEEGSPVSKVENFVKEMKSGTLVVILSGYLLADEEEAIQTFAEGTGGFVLKLMKRLEEPKDDVEVEFMKRMESRVGKYLGMKILRGEIE